MTQTQNTETNPNQGSAEAQPAQDTVLSAGESSVQAMLSLVREYNSNAAFFNVVIPPLMLQADLALPLVGPNTQIMSFLNSYVPRLDGQINGLFGRAGLEIPAHLQQPISTKVQTSNKEAPNQNNVNNVEQG